jgi:DNA polymerase-3 subunit gamma/tau
VYDFNRITVPDTIAYLQKVAANEGVTASEEALNVVAQKADGGMRDALSIFDQLVAFCGNNITYEQTIAVLNVLNADYYFQLVEAALAHDVTKALLLFNDVLNHGFNAAHFVTGMAQHLRDVLVSKDPQTLPLLETSDAIRQRYAQQAQHCAPVWLFQALDILNTCDINYRTARNKRLTVELALVKLCQLGVPQTIPTTQTIPNTQNTPNTPTTPKPESKPSNKTEGSNPQTISNIPPKVEPAPSIPKIPSISLGLGKKKEPIANSQQPIANSQVGPAIANSQPENRPFTADQLRDAWVGLATAHKEELRLKQLIESYTPHVLNETTAQIQMPNPWQMSEMKKALPELVNQLRKVLHNNALQIELVQAEYNQEQMAFTAEEKYKLMVEQNPALAQLKERLDLSID